MTSIENLIDRAENNDHAAQLVLGEHYAWGYVIGQDHDRSDYWLTRAGESRDPAILYKLSQSYAYGSGVPKDEAKEALYMMRALKTYLNAYESLSLGLANAVGYAGEPDAEAVKFWLDRVARSITWHMEDKAEE